MASGELSLDEAVRRTVTAQTGRRPDGPIRVLTHLRYFGYIFNPVTFYYCFDSSGTEGSDRPRRNHQYAVERTARVCPSRLVSDAQ